MHHMARRDMRPALMSFLICMVYSTKDECCDKRCEGWAVLCRCGRTVGYQVSSRSRVDLTTPPTFSLLPTHSLPIDACHRYLHLHSTFQPSSDIICTSASTNGRITQTASHIFDHRSSSPLEVAEVPLFLLNPAAFRICALLSAFETCVAKEVKQYY